MSISTKVSEAFGMNNEIPPQRPEETIGRYKLLTNGIYPVKLKFLLRGKSTAANTENPNPDL